MFHSAYVKKINYVIFAIPLFVRGLRYRASILISPIQHESGKNASPPLNSVPAFEEYCGAGCDLSVPGLLSDDRQTCGGHSHNYTL